MKALSIALVGLLASASASLAGQIIAPPSTWDAADKKVCQDSVTYGATIVPPYVNEAACAQIVKTFSNAPHPYRLGCIGSNRAPTLSEVGGKWASTSANFCGWN